MQNFLEHISTNGFLANVFRLSDAIEEAEEKVEEAYSIKKEEGERDNTKEKLKETRVRSIDRICEEPCNPDHPLSDLQALRRSRGR